jgi:hypothetical protein
VSCLLLWLSSHSCDRGNFRQPAQSFQTFPSIDCYTDMVETKCRLQNPACPSTIPCANKNLLQSDRPVREISAAHWVLGQLFHVVHNAAGPTTRSWPMERLLFVQRYHFRGFFQSHINKEWGSKNGQHLLLLCKSFSCHDPWHASKTTF